MIVMMRDFARPIIFIAGVAFVATIFFAWGMDFAGASSQPAAGSIDGQRVALDAFDRMVRGERERLEQQYNGDVPPEQYRMVSKQVWERIVSEKVLTKVFGSMGLSASADEVFAYLRNNPPPGLDTMERFKTNGVFDTSKYEALLNTPAIYDNPGWREMEFQTQKLVIPNTKLEVLVGAGVLPSTSELQYEYRQRMERCVFEYAFVPAQDMKVDSGEVTDAMVAKYYSANPDSFRTGEQVDLYYVTVPKVVTAADEQMYQDELLEIKARIESGEGKFADEAQGESDDEGSAKNGGDLGWFGKGQMVPPFEMAAFAAAPGQIVGPVRSSFGYHIILVEGKRVQDGQEQVSARHILRKVAPSIETLDSIKGILDSLIDLSDSGDGIIGSAKLLGHQLRVDSTGLFGRDDPIPSVGYLGGVISFALTSEVGTVSESVFENKDAFYVFELKRKQKAGVRDVADVRDRIVRVLSDSLKMQKAREVLTAAVSGASSLAAFSQTNPAVASGVSDTVTRTSYVAPVGYANEAIAVAFSLPLNSVSTPVQVMTGVAAVKPLWRNVLDSIPSSGPVLASMRSSMARMEQQKVFMDWYNQSKKALKVKSSYEQYFME